jgi:hypothetical protein
MSVLLVRDAPLLSWLQLRASVDKRFSAALAAVMLRIMQSASRSMK